MMRKALFLLAAAAAFGLPPLAGKLGSIGGSALLLVIAIALAVAASGAPIGLAAAGGALGAFSSAVLGGVSPILAGAALTGFAFAERTTRVRDRAPRLLHIGVTIAVGAIAAPVAAAYAGSPAAVRGVAILVAAVLAALPLLIEADDPLANALDGAADDVGEPARAYLREGAELRRTAFEALLDRSTQRQVRATWASLARLAEARVRLEGARAATLGSATSSATSAARSASAGKGGDGAHTQSVIKVVDQRISEHVAGLTRALTAASAARAAEVSLDDTALRDVETAGESLEHVSRAIVDEV